MSDIGKRDGSEIREATLVEGDVSVTILSFGAVTRDWRVGAVPVLLGYDDPAAYLGDPLHLGAIAGRVANRTAQGRFVLGGRTYQLDQNIAPHHLHGGAGGLGRRNWRMEADGDRAVQLRYHARDGEQGYPGAVDFTVTIRLAGHRLSYLMQAAPDRPTPVNLAQHNYYNLAGGGDIWDHRLQIAASGYTPTDADSIPTGQIAPLDGTRYDFRVARSLGAADPGHQGSDINLVLDPSRDPQTPAAEVTAPNGMRLRLWTQEPGLQLYNAMHMPDTPGGLDGQSYGRFSGLCLEAQHFPDALNHPEFASIICTPDRPYRQELVVEIAPTEAVSK